MIGRSFVPELIFEDNILIENCIIDVFEEIEGVISFEKNVHGFDFEVLELNNL